MGYKNYASESQIDRLVSRKRKWSIVRVGVRVIINFRLQTGGRTVTVGEPVAVFLLAAVNAVVVLGVCAF